MTSSEPVIITCSYGGLQGRKGNTGANGNLAWQDDWASDHGTYYANDFVYHPVSGHGKGLFRCILEHDPSVAATEPVVGGSASTYWETSIGGGQNGSVIGEGAPGGQTIQGGTEYGDDLTFLPTSNEYAGTGEFHFNLGYLHARFNAHGKPRPSGFANDGGLCVSWNYVGGSRSVDLWNTDIANIADTSFWFRQLQDASYATLLKIQANGDLVSSGVLSGNGLSLSGPVKQSILSKTANYTITDTDPDIVVVGVISAHATITLPTAADNTGRIITVIIDGEPGSYNVVVDGEGEEKINGAATKTNSVIYSYLRLLCNGTSWDIIGSAGTWS